MTFLPDFITCAIKNIVKKYFLRDTRMLLLPGICTRNHMPRKKHLMREIMK